MALDRALCGLLQSPCLCFSNASAKLGHKTILQKKKRLESQYFVALQTQRKEGRMRVSSSLGRILESIDERNVAASNISGMVWL